MIITLTEVYIRYISTVNWSNNNTKERGTLQHSTSDHGTTDRTRDHRISWALIGLAYRQYK